CTIFETLNRTGVKLSVFELLTARFWPRGVNLRQLWAECKAENPVVADFDIDPYYVLQAIALAARATPSCKRSDVIDLTTADIDTWWTKASRGMAQALRLLREDCGVLVSKWLPYNTIIIPFTAILAKRPVPAGPQAAVARGKLVRWCWCSAFGQTYENAPNSQAARDVVEVLAWLDGGAAPQSVAQFRFDPKLLRDTTASQRALYRGAICLILRNGARDFRSGRPSQAISSSRTTSTTITFSPPTSSGPPTTRSLRACVTASSTGRSSIGRRTSGSATGRRRSIWPTSRTRRRPG
ncbi:MAG: hypothetical protein ACXW3X_15650, partial [Rhodoplanes sp.]